MNTTNTDQTHAATVDSLARRKRMLVAFALLAFVLLGASMRLRAALETEPWPPLQGDSVDYVSGAYNMRHFAVFSHANTWAVATQIAPKPDAVRDPGYSAMLALLLPDYPDFTFFKRALLLQALLGTLVVVVSYFFAVQLLPRPAALAATLLIAVNPQLIQLGTSLLTETLFSLVVVSFLYAIVRAALRGSVAWYGIAGILIGLSALIRPTLEFLPLLLVPAVIWIAPRAGWKHGMALLFGMILTFGPWVVRNERAIGAASDPTLMTNTLLDGSYKDFMYEGQYGSLGFPYRFDPEAPAILTPGQALARIGEDFKSDPAGMLRWYVLSKPVRFFDWEFLEGAGSIFINSVKRSPYLEGQSDFVVSYAIMYFLHWPLIVLGYAGIVIALIMAIRKSRTPEQCALGALAITMVFVIGLHVIGFPLGRYSVPFRPLTYLLALYALVSATRWALARFR